MSASPSTSATSRSLPAQPSLRQLKKQAKEFLKAFAAGEADSVAEVERHEGDLDAAAFSLVDAQRLLARSYGFTSWPALTRHVDGLTVENFCLAAERNDLEALRKIVAGRPELVRMERRGNDEHTALHYAVLNRDSKATHLLLEAGADPHKGIYPHRDATSPLTLATERGFAEIVELIEVEVARRRSNVGATHSDVDLLHEEIRHGRTDEALRRLEEDASLVDAPTVHGRTPLHAAAAARDLKLMEWLMTRCADVSSLDASALPPLDRAVLSVRWTQREETAGQWQRPVC